MTTLAVFAHFDPGGQVAPHVQRYLAALAPAVDRLVVVSASPLDDDGRATLAGYGELVERENEGYDFSSWKRGLEHAGDWGDHRRVVLCNDSVVGPFRPFPEVLANAPVGVDFWGMTVSRELAPHVQSWFTVFERGALGSGVLHGFWRAQRPISDRYTVIRRYEVGLSTLLRSAGLVMGSYLRPTAADLARAQLRYRHAMRARPDRAAAARRATAGMSRLQRLDRQLRPAWNPSYVFWDGALTGRLPFVKLEMLRDDPYRMGPGRALAALEAARPEQLAGVRDYLDRTRAQFKALRGL